jgi:hypothetical protein
MFTGNDLGRLGTMEKKPNLSEIEAAATLPQLLEIRERLAPDPEEMLERILELCLLATRSGRLHEAWTLIGLCELVKSENGL